MKARPVLYVVAAGSIIAALWGVAELGVRYAVANAVSIYGLRTAQLWTDHLEMMAAEGMHMPHDDHASDGHIAIEAGDAGDVVHYHVITLDEEHMHTAEHHPGEVPVGMHEHSDVVTKVLATGQSFSVLHSGNQQEGTPATYVEAFIPLPPAGDGSPKIAQIMVNQTVIADLLRRAFGLFSLGLTVVMAVIFGIPYGAFLVKNRQEARSRRQADYLARYDQVTGLLNRAGFAAGLEKGQNEGKIELSRTGVFFIDLDRFKTINDTYGHRIGDALLQHLGEAIMTSLAPGDLAGRLGGDEFCIVVQRDDLAAMEALAENIRIAVAQPLHRDGETIIGHASIGVHFDPDAELTLDERMQKADIALYQAKLDGRNTYRVFTSELQVRQERRQRVEKAIRAGIAEDRFDLHFQPLLDRESRQCAGFEALLRLKDADENPIPPAEFIPVAESMGLIERVGTWVLEQAARRAAEWPAPLFVAVNLSARQFDDGNLVSIVRRVLEETGLDPARLELEVTESLLLENADHAAMQLDQLRELGVAIAMDDFGTGYSSLGYLWKFGFDKIKIDRSFIAGLDSGNNKIREILESIVLLGHRLDMRVTAEGVETEEQARLLAELSFDQFQGFLYGRPMSVRDLGTYLNTSPKKAAGNRTGG